MYPPAAGVRPPARTAQLISGDGKPRLTAGGLWAARGPTAALAGRGTLALGCLLIRRGREFGEGWRWREELVGALGWSELGGYCGLPDGDLQSSNSPVVN